MYRVAKLLRTPTPIQSQHRRIVRKQNTKPKNMKVLKEIKTFPYDFNFSRFL